MQRREEINELNFRVTKTPLDGPAVFTVLPPPGPEEADTSETWKFYIQRTINFFYRCAPVESVSLGDSATGCEVLLRPGIDGAWLEPHLLNFAAEIAQARSSTALPSLGRIRSSVIS